ncbi:MAG: PSD1 and planctomycete cytochrome C domain-containing protein [Fuerstiella sp.]|nr:PSD1 and planctomycete cytochrome C domain-containing protein [Fuerstiella sp.]
MRCFSAVLTLLSVFLVNVLPGRAADNLTYEQHIRPIFRQHCFDCHGAEQEKEAELDLRLVRFMIRGGESGPAIVTGDPDHSLLIQRIRDGEMPPGESKVSVEELTLLEQWVAAGAKTARLEPEAIGPGLGITPEERSFWSFRPIERPEVPAHDETSRVRTPIDALLLAVMQPHELQFSSDADRRTLMLRAYFDLIGLPPSDQEADEFLSDVAPGSWERLIERLLRSPHYGERWGRHWLDVAGYADSEGAGADADRPWAWRYRDYVIRSFNQDKPFDQFIVEQLAGDELAGPKNGDYTEEQIELLIATGFLRTAADGTGSGNNNPNGRNQVMTDTIKIVTTSLMGLSVACAQCHDHRYDPIPQTDYYALRATLEPAIDWQAWKTPEERRVSLYTKEDHEKSAEIEKEAAKVTDERAAKQRKFMEEALTKELSKYDEPLQTQLRSAYETSGDIRTPEQMALLKKYPSTNITPGNLYQYNQAAADEIKKIDEKISEIRAKKPPHEYVRALVEPSGHIPETRLFHRGDHRQPKFEVAPASLTVAAPENDRPFFSSNDPELSTSGRRLAFSKWLTSGRHPLVARTIVNRVWLHHFGRGIVETPADFGRLGTQPSHPVLLDWLAAEFMENGWKLSHLHRIIMTSTAYLQTSARSEEFNQIDPDNRYYWRKSLIRLEAEILRDRMLSASEQLNRELFGKPIPVREDDTGQVVVDDTQKRRSIYIQQRRTRPVALMKAFDAPVMVTNCDRRQSSTVATQSLMLMNGGFVLSQAADLATVATAEVMTLEQRVANAWQLALCRPPTDVEKEISIRFINEQLAAITAEETKLPENVTPDQQALADLCQVLLTSNEFLYVD